MNLEVKLSGELGGASRLGIGRLSAERQRLDHQQRNEEEAEVLVHLGDRDAFEYVARYAIAVHGSLDVAAVDAY